MPKTNRGFTLIELLVVIAIVGILSSLVLTNLTNARRKSRDARRVSDIRQVQNALALYAAANSNQYPVGPYSALATALVPDHLPSLPQNPGVEPYLYCQISVSDYHLATTLEDAVHPALEADSDLNTTCLGGQGDNIAGADPVYDVKP